jgi:hypothetical protein
MQEGQGIPPERKGLESTTVAIIVIAVVAVVIVGSVGAYLLLREVLEEIDDNANYEYTEPIEHEYPAESYTALDVSNVNGYVKVIGNVDATTIDIDGLKKAHSEEELDDVELQITEDDGTLVLVVIHELDDNTNESMDLDISIPSDIVVKNAESINGEVEVSGVESVTSVSVTNGAIMLEIIGIDSNVSVSTVNGAIDVYVLTSLNATIDMTTINGAISLNDVSLDITVNESNHVNGELNSGGYEIDIGTINGAIDLHALG